MIKKDFHIIKGVILFILIYNCTFLSSQTIIIKPYLQDVQQNQTSVMWEVDNVGKGYIDFGTSPFTLNQTASSNDIIGNGNSRIHVVTMIGLSPKTKYYYRVRMQSGSYSNIYHFVTLPLNNTNYNVEFVAVSDMQRDGGNPGVFKNLIENGVVVVCDTIFENGFKDLEGIVIPGDLVQTGGAYNSWRTDFFNLCDSVTPYIPLYPVPGNHEYYSGGLPNFLKYFHLPLNGSASNPEEWWHKDISNVKLIGLNSNSGSTDLNKQLLWLDTVLLNAGQNADIDFVFAQLHHPFKSELWTPGELDFTGDIITKLENFSTTYNKPSIHFFGHTHAYSRGASRDHSHFWINVATAGGAIDNWGEFPNADYDEFTLSEDEYGFVLMQVTAGYDPSFRIRRFSRGDQNGTENNTLSDDFTFRMNEHTPMKPTGIYPVADTVAISCVKLKASKFNDVENSHQASHWQISESCNFSDIGTINLWKQSENWYNEVNTQAGDDLTDEDLTTLQANKSYCWRVRYRDNYFKWSPWSEVKTFHTKTAAGNTFTANLIQNSGAENGAANWTGQIESLTNNECNSVPVFDGLRFFAVGGVCSNESSVGYSPQMIDISSYATAIDSGLYNVLYSAYMRAYASNNDVPELYIEFLNQQQTLLTTSSSISNTNATWTNKVSQYPVPLGTRFLKVMLKGTRLAGTDNDSYFDNINVQLITQQSCPSCIGSQNNFTDNDGDGYCSVMDCNDNNDNVNPGNIEICDNIDNNCDGLTDTGTSVIWNGNGTNKNWKSDQNWNQAFMPLLCQHTILNGSDTVFISERAYINSLEIAANVVLKINEGGELVINGYHDGNNSSLYIAGTLINEGRIKIKNSNADGISLQGTVINHQTIETQDITLKDIKLGQQGVLINNGTILLE